MTSELLCSSWLHFKYHRIIEWLSFLIHLPYHLLFHSFDPYSDKGYQGYTIRGFIICDCDYVIDLGMSYGMHCEECYNRVTEKTRLRT